MSEVDNVSWLTKYWPQILFFVSLGTIGVKNQVDTRSVKKAVFDKNNNIRFVSKDDCIACQERHSITESERARELQNIHSSIDSLRKTVSDMPKEICEHLKTMGLLK